MMKVPSPTLVSRATRALRGTTRKGSLRLASPHVRGALAVVPLRHHYFSSDTSHDDFAPQRKAAPDADEAVQMIAQHVKENPIMLYMKGSPRMPMCGFSAKVVQALQAEGADFASVNVLDYPSIREGVKKFSDWPTVRSCICLLVVVLKSILRTRNK